MLGYGALASFSAVSDAVNAVLKIYRHAMFVKRSYNFHF
ncbi:MAG: hypothetical protein AVDCRST_MAG96-2691 [uncultured Segetibacter sp.]|uniref:Uncharacterized protein n=1 Tax=uncultured Segetibacter sp. TaxID=481133 RepID=A0A6J4T8B2_9BACT|nr:MAG: hypothetical protein AVDCRST_MAG96-2691 [uncultured Segetibacter sp.]